ncbi:TetR/AcrR family transcriptional regulator [Kitasatospora sp. NPDC059648]|uniref:TetR/AcrR family transcriptional regulator n=1 Tax=Kitasatospora sp. NPDC059648 TaxID=3346894 RepID=UPI003680C661
MMRTDAMEVLDWAIPVLAKDRAASMQVIAKGAGISRATLVRLFPTRQHLVQAMAAKILDDCDRALSRAGADTAPVRQVLAALVAEYPAFAQLWNLVYARPDVLGVAEIGVRADAIFDRTVAFFERGQGVGLLRKDMPATWLASTFCGLAETAWELTMEGYMGARQAPGFIPAILLYGAAA